jgi:hypothetical protein
MRFAKSLGGLDKKALQQLFDGLLAVEGGAHAQWRVGGHAGGDRLAIDLGDGEPALDRRLASARVGGLH